MAAHYASDRIRVNVVAPGLIATPMSTRAQQDPATRDYLRVRQPLTAASDRPKTWHKRLTTWHLTEPPL